MSGAPRVPKIACLPNGPYYLLLEAAPAEVPFLRRSNGEACATVRAVALCRCGGSANKPFCDGSHMRIGFTTDPLPGPLPREREAPRKSYAGRHITIHDDRGICAHAGFCTEELKAVFREEADPWIDPDGAAATAIIATIAKCPSGALSYSIDGIVTRDRGGPPMVLVTDDGPYAVSGGVELAGVELAPGASRDHYTLCRCGASKNKPFCDGSHWEVGFRDPPAAM
jgi:CDGSH-type Zn-finger protein